VPDFAATLTTQAEHENLNFLRTRSRYLTSRDTGRTRPAADDVVGISYVEGRGLRRSLLIRQRFGQREQESRLYRDQAYGDRIPIYRPGQQQSVYDWAPASSDDEDEDEANQFLPPHLDHDSIDELAGQHSAYANGPESLTGRAGTPPPPFTYTPRTHTPSTSRLPELSSHHPQSSEPLLRNALMQTIRRHPRLSQRSRNQLQSYISERERSVHEGGRSNLRPSTMQVQTNELRARVDAYRQRYLENPSGNPPTPSRWLEEAIKYLERLRFSSSYEDSLSSAAEGGLVRDEFLSVDHEDFILDTACIDAPPESSWLKIGGVFEGSQYAAHDNHALFHRLSGDLSAGSSPSTATGGPPPTDSRILWASIHSPRHTVREDRWPVKVTIHAIDYNTMQLSGTMEAFNVPDWQSETGKSSIITYLEGEIIDFRTHSLETKNFPCTAEVDGTYWRKLEPFAGLDDSELVKTLVSKKWLTEQLSKNWILMRWKGKLWDQPNNSTFITNRANNRKMFHYSLLSSLRPHHLRLLLPFPSPFRRLHRRILLRPNQLPISAIDLNPVKEDVSNIRLSLTSANWSSHCRFRAIKIPLPHGDRLRDT
jgi:Vacuolar import and degradation protein